MRIASREPVNDSFIKKTALELANARGIGKVRVFRRSNPEPLLTAQTCLQDKFKASSGWVENFKHRHDLRKGGLWDKSGNSSWAAAAAAAKYSQGPNGANGADGEGEEDFHGDSAFGVVGFHHGAEE